MTATATWTGDPAPTVQWQWLRCADAKGNCAEIAGATAALYVVVGADVGSLLRVRVTVTNKRGVGHRAVGPDDRGHRRSARAGAHTRAHRVAEPRAVAQGGRRPFTCPA